MPTKRNHRPPRSRWEAAAQLVLALGEEHSVDVLADRGLEQACVVLGADGGLLHLLELNGLALELKAASGFRREALQRILRVPLDMPSLTTRAALTGELQVVPDVSELTDAVEIIGALAREHELCGLVSIPLRAHGRLVGVLTCGKRRRMRLTGSEVALVEVLAHALASGILNTRAFEEERRVRLALEAVDEATLAIAAELEPSRVLQAIVDRAREVTGARYAALGIGTDRERSFQPWLFSGIDEEHARLIGHHPRPRGLLGAVPAEGKAIRVANMEADARYVGFPAHHPAMKSFLGVPIRARGESIGNLYLADKQDAAQFSAEDQRAVESLAAHAAIAYRHAQLYEQAEAERARLLTVLESSPIGIIFVDKTSGHTIANSAAQELFGQAITLSGGREQYLAQYANPDGTPVADDEVPSTRALNGEAVVGVELVLRRNDGREIPVLINAVPVHDARGDVTGAIVLWQDISPLKLERLREEFISVVAHELRAPITVISGYADLLKRKMQGEGDLRAIESIRVSVRRLERLVQDLLDASRIEAQRLQLERRPLDLAELARELIDRLHDLVGGRQVELTTKGAPQLVAADTGRIEQVLTNLLTNAAKYSPPETPIRVTIEEQSDQVLVSVANEGPGIGKTELGRLFTRFYRTRSAMLGRAEGIGLGLYIARGLVEAHGGRIWAASEPGRGAVFSFTLPAIREAEAVGT